jgi:uncharacterized glyoxalase superfamily metalloenzyme YdcJ
MATAAERRVRLRNALERELASQGARASKEVLDLFVNRAMDHIDNRWNLEANRDQEVDRAVKNVAQVVRNLVSFSGSSISLTESRTFIGNQTNCIFPWCRPKP